MAGADVNAAVLFHISLVLLLVDRACLAVLAGGVVLDSGIAFQVQVCVARVVHITVRHVVEDSAAVSLYHTRYHNSLTKKGVFSDELFILCFAQKQFCIIAHFEQTR